MATDNLDQWRKIIEQVLTDYAALPYSYSQIKKGTVFDRTQDQYLILILGWEDHRYEHGCTVHIDIIDGKIWIQRDGTEDGIALDLENAGIPKTSIVLASNLPKFIR